jgi:hypothetical protein
MNELFRFPDPVNEVSARLVAGGVVLMALSVTLLDQHWVLIPLAYGFIARVFTGPSLSPLGQLVTRVITPRLAAPAKLVPGPPKRFAQGMGAVVTTSAALLWFVFDQQTAALALAWMIVVAATLESVFAFCIGCKIFAGLMRLGVIPESVCERCNNVTLDSTL